MLTVVVPLPPHTMIVHATFFLPEAILGQSDDGTNRCGDNLTLRLDDMHLHLIMLMCEINLW